MTWSEVLAPIKILSISKPYGKRLMNSIKHKMFSTEKSNFSALELTPFEDVEVVIIGQDPYHNDGQANGLCFSVSESVTAPPSLKNIFTELKDDLNINRTKRNWMTGVSKVFYCSMQRLPYRHINPIHIKIWDGRNSQIM